MIHGSIAINNNNYNVFVFVIFVVCVLSCAVLSVCMCLFCCSLCVQFPFFLIISQLYLSFVCILIFALMQYVYLRRLGLQVQVFIEHLSIESIVWWISPRCPNRFIFGRPNIKKRSGQRDQWQVGVPLGSAIIIILMFAHGIRSRLGKLLRRKTRRCMIV